MKTITIILTEHQARRFWQVMSKRNTEPALEAVIKQIPDELRSSQKLDIDEKDPI